MEEVTTKSGMSTGMVIGIAVLVAIVFGGGAYAYVSNKAAQEKKDLNAQISELQSQVSSATTVTTVPSSATSATSATDATANWATYTNSKYNYSFKYPSTVKLTASLENSDDLPISPTAVGVNVFPSNGSVGNGIFFVSVPNIDFTTSAIKNQFSATKPENISTTSTTISGSSAYKVTISGDSSVVSTFYFIKSPSGTVLELTVLNSSQDAQNIYTSFQFTK